MELMDWKNIEAGAERQVRDAEVQRIVGSILLREAVLEIKKLGGKSSVEEAEEAKSI